MRYFIALTITALILGISGPALCDTVYTWTDKDGVVHMTNYPPPGMYTEKTAISSPEETPEERAFRARQKAALDRLDHDFKKKEPRVERAAPPTPRKEIGETPEERRARIRQEITDLEAKEKRYHSLSKRAYSDSDRQYWYQQQKATQAEIDNLKRELTR